MKKTRTILYMNDNVFLLDPHWIHSRYTVYYILYYRVVITFSRRLELEFESKFTFKGFDFDVSWADLCVRYWTCALLLRRQHGLVYVNDSALFNYDNR
jgi:hypothetical protein